MDPALPLVVTPKIAEKLAKKSPPVTVREVEQCFVNRHGGLLTDRREKHKTDPPTLWFVARTNGNRLLKVIYVARDGKIFLKSAYDADPVEQDIYQRKACP